MQINQSTLRMSVATSFAWLTHIILRLHGQHQPPSLSAEYGKTMCASLGHTDIPKEVVLGEKAGESQPYAVLACNNIPYVGIALQDYEQFLYSTQNLQSPHEIIFTTFICL